MFTICTICIKRVVDIKKKTKTNVQNILCVVPHSAVLLSKMIRVSSTEDLSWQQTCQQGLINIHIAIRQFLIIRAFNNVRA
jgi:hypothetical protein